MRLVKLSANKESFHEVKFNTKGLSLIVGKKENREDKNIRKTYNGVGKSLIIHLIHFCLGSSFNEEFQKKLPDWEFSLEFLIDEKTFVSKRKTNEQDNIYLNDNKYKLKEFKKLLAYKLFNLQEEGYISFRSLISRFIRYGKQSYNNATTFIRKEQEHVNLLNNSYLLGLDINYILKKIELKEKYDNDTIP